MTYPDNVDNFNEKLNKRQDGTPYVIEEEIAIESGIYEGILGHDNISSESIRVYTGEKLTGDEIRNFIISIPETTPWCRKIKIFTNEAKVYVTYETIGDQVEADDINRLQNSIVSTQEEVNRYKTINDESVNTIDSRLTTAENNKAEKTYVDTELLKKADQLDTYTKSETDNRISQVVGAAPQALDTLKEIAESLNNDDDFAGTMTAQLAGKVDKAAGKQLSTEDYSTSEKSKLAGIEANANKYIHPSTHPATSIVQDTNNRFVTDSDIADWNDANTKKHIHTNKSVLDGISQALIDGWNNAVTHISDVVRHITSSERTLWNTVSNKVDKVTGKQLSTEDYSTAEKSKLAGIENGANQYVHPSTHSMDMMTESTTKKIMTDVERAKLVGIEANAEVNNISDAHAADLTDGGDSALHYHSGDRNRANHTGIQSASTISNFAATVRGTVLSGLSTINNAVITATDTILSALGKLQKQISDNLATLNNHISNKSNPHSVTKSQVGLGSVDNTSDANKPISTAAQTALNTKLDKTDQAVDSDLLDGQQGSYYLSWNNFTNMPSVFNPTPHTHDYLPLTGGTLTGKISIADGNSIVFMDSNGEGMAMESNGEHWRLYEPEDSNKTWLEFKDDDGLYVFDTKVSLVNHNHNIAYEPKNTNIQAHIASAHAPSNAQKNSDITKAEIEAKLTGNIASHSHSPDHTHSNKAVLDKLSMSGSETSFDLSDFVTSDELGAAGYGDMLKAVYDTNGNGKVDSADNADSVAWSGISGKPSTYSPSSHNHNYLPLTGGTITGNLTIQDSVALTIGEGLKFLSQGDYFPGSTYYDARIIRMIDANGASGNVDGGLVIEGYTNTDGLRKEVMTIRTNGEFTFLGNNVYHAGNFDPSTKLNKGPLTWNDLKGV